MLYIKENGGIVPESIYPYRKVSDFVRLLSIDCVFWVTRRICVMISQ